MLLFSVKNPGSAKGSAAFIVSYLRNSLAVPSNMYLIPWKLVSLEKSATFGFVVISVKLYMALTMCFKCVSNVFHMRFINGKQCVYKCRIF